MTKLFSEEIQPHAKKKVLQRNLYVLYAISALNGMQFVSPVLVPFFGEWGGLDFSQIMILQSIFFITVMVSEIPLGAIADCVSKRVSISLSLVMTMLGIIFYSITPRFFMFVIAEILWGCANSLLSGADSSLLYDTLVEQKREKDTSVIYGRYDSFRLMGYLISAPIGSLLATSVGLKFTMLIMVVPVSVAAFISLFMIEPIPQNQTGRSYFNLIISGFKALWVNKGLRILLLDMLIVGSLSSHVIFTYQLKLALLGTNQSQYGWILMIYLGSSIIFSNIQKLLVKLLKIKKRVLFIMTIGAGIGLLCLSYANYLSGTIIGISLVAGCGFVYFRINFGCCQIYIKSGERSTVISTMNMIRLLILSGVNAFIGFMAEWNLSAVFILFGLLMIFWSIITPLRENHLNGSKTR